MESQKEENLNIEQEIKSEIYHHFIKHYIEHKIKLEFHENELFDPLDADEIQE